MAELTKSETLIIKAASLYYITGLTQEQIAKQFGVSRPTVVRMLKKAVDEGYVEIRMTKKLPRTMELETQLHAKYATNRLNHIIVVESDGNDEDAKIAVGIASAEYLEQNLKKDQSLGIGWSSTLTHIPKYVKNIKTSPQRVVQLGDALKNGQVRNATLIQQYAAKVSAQKPSLSSLVNEFKKDASTQGPMYLSLLDRVNTAKNQPQMFASSQALYDELLNIYQAADPVLYSEALSDPLNVLADMSDGQLPRINSLSKAQSKQANNAQDFGTGEQLIGNPSYGHWQTGSNGMSFWAWYGMYSMMGDLFGRRTYYNDWGRSRN